MARIAAFIVVVTLWQVPAAAAQAPEQTLQAFANAIAAAQREADLATADPALNAEIDGYLDTLKASGLLTRSMNDVAEAVHNPRVSALSRMPSGLLAPKALDAISQLQGLANHQLRDALKAKVPPTRVTAILQPVADLHVRQLEASIARSEEILRKYERKFGPDSARLNGLEVFLNYGLQRVPRFGPNAEGEPGPLEAIASYSPTYMTYAAGKARMVSATEFGLRHYLFGQAWGQKGIKGLLRPAFFTFGMAVAGEEDGPMKWPWKGDRRVGGFFSWGEMKVAYVKGERNQRLMVSRQFQLIPFVF